MVDRSAKSVVVEVLKKRRRNIWNESLFLIFEKVSVLLTILIYIMGRVTIKNQSVLSLYSLFR